jgi:APA family basic amino acid/polyamine antiporter
MTEVSAGARGAGPSSDATPFVRQSSGLVKSGTPYRMFLMNAAYNGLGTYMAFFYFYSAGAFPRGNLVLGVVIVAILQIVFNGAYALLAIAYPRSGGEYVYLSRIVHPAVGFAVSVGAAIAQTFWVAVGGYWVCTLVLAPALTAYGGVTGHPGAIDAGKWFAVSNHAWLVSAIAIVLSALLVWRGLRVYFRFQSINWWIGWICFAVFLVVLGTSSHQDFINGVNRYGENTSGIHNAYQTVLNAAQKGGMPTSFSLWQTLGITAVFTAVAATAYVGGEVRKPRRTQLIAMVGGSGSFAIISVLVAILLAKTVSTDWNRAASWLAMNDPHHYPFAVNPVYMWYADLLTTHPTVVIIMTVGFVIWSYFWIPICMLWATRMVFAWSFDRLVPAKAAAVSEKTGSPTVAVVAVAVIAEFLLWLYARSCTSRPSSSTGSSGPSSASPRCCFPSCGGRATRSRNPTSAGGSAGSPSSRYWACSGSSTGRSRSTSRSRRTCWGRTRPRCCGSRGSASRSRSCSSSWRAGTGRARESTSILPSQSCRPTEDGTHQ